MIKFQSDNIIVGYIKNLLTDFKLPTPKKYISDKYCVHGQLYIKDDFVCLCTINNLQQLQFKPLFRYVEDGQLNNYYTQLKFTGINYDSYTHKYLGEYLRYLRDFKDLNLMSLYNCYSDEFPKKMNIYNKSKILYSTDNKNYKYIMMPVKLDQKYTIAIDCNTKYDVFCILYGDNFYQQENLFKATHKKISSSSFNEPYLYEGLIQVEEGNNQDYLINTHSINDLYKKISDKERDLKLVIKLPATNTSSIVVLEGDYLHNNDFVFNTKMGDNYDPFKIQYNYSVPNFDFNINLPDNETYDASKVNLISSLQLLNLNTSVNYPFSDRLIEYLTNNAICNTETISDNIKRIQKSLYNEWLDKDKQGLTTTWGKSSLGPHYGIWDDKLKLNFYNLAKAKKLLNEKNDILGYVDKDIESNLGPYADIYSEED